MAILTLGHSIWNQDQFITVLRASGVSAVVDIRSHRTSKWPWWHGEQMDRWLPAAGFDSLWMEGLGGWSERMIQSAGVDLDWGAARGVKLDAYARGYFPKQRIGATKLADQPELDGETGFVSGWTNQGLHDYAWWTATAPFRESLDDLIDRYGAGRGSRCVIVCAERLWWKCHRSMVADVLVGARGVYAGHLTPQLKGIRLDPHSTVIGDRLSRYPDAVRAEWSR